MTMDNTWSCGIYVRHVYTKLEHCDQ